MVFGPVEIAGIHRIAWGLRNPSSQEMVGLETIVGSGLGVRWFAGPLGSGLRPLVGLTGRFRIA